MAVKDPENSIKKSVREILSENRKKTSPLLGKVTLWAHNIRSMHNIGAIFRSADAFGITGILLSGYSPRPPRAEISKTALGAEQHVKWQYSDNPDETATELIKSGTLLLGLEQTHNSVAFSNLSVTNDKICLILGNEVTGLDELFYPYIETFVEIPQYGTKHSLNVSVAAGIALYALHELQSQL